MANTGVWALTLWTAGRVPSLVSFGPKRIEASLLGTLVLERWHQMARAFPDLIIDEFAILPDRFRAIVHAPTVAQIELALAWFRAAIAQESRLARLSASGVVWETGPELEPVDTVEELQSWRRRIRTGRSLGLSGRLPNDEAPGYPGCLSGNGTSTAIPSRAIDTEPNTEVASARSSGASRL